MDKHEAALMRAEEAERILASPIFEAAFNDTRQAILEALAGLPSMDSKEAARLHNMVSCLAKVRRCLEEHVSTGKIAKVEIEGRRRGFLGALRRA